MPPQGASTKLKVPGEQGGFSPRWSRDDGVPETEAVFSVCLVLRRRAVHVKTEETLKGQQPENPLLAAGWLPTQ